MLLGDDVSNNLIMFLSIGFAGIATGLGAIPILLTENISRRLLDILLGFAAVSYTHLDVYKRQQPFCPSDSSIL